MAGCTVEDSSSSSTPTVEELEALGDVWNQTFSFVTSMSLKCAVDLRIPDAIHAHGAAITLPQLAAALSVAPAKLSALRCLMRLLVHNGCFAKQAKSSADEDDAYVLTPISRLLVSSKPTSVAPLVTLELHPLFVETWLLMATWFRGSAPTVFHAAHGKEIFDYFPRHPELAAGVKSMIEKDSQLVGAALVEKHPEVFDGVGSMVDVTGCVGAKGALAAVIAEAFPQLKCSVLEDHVVAAAFASAKRPPVNLEFVAGDMFEHIPSADLLMLKWVLMTYNDEDCVKILKRCKEAIKDHKGGRVVIIDIVLKEEAERFDKSSETHLFFDMLTMVMRGGKQREEQEWSKLFTEAGFSNYKITPFGPRSLIQVYP